MPDGAKMLSAQLQNNILCLWAEVDTREPLREHFIEIAGTGNPLRSDMSVERIFIDTVQDPSCGLVWHVFERI